MASRPPAAKLSRATVLSNIACGKIFCARALALPPSVLGEDERGYSAQKELDNQEILRASLGEIFSFRAGETMSDQLLAPL